MPGPGEQGEGESPPAGQLQVAGMAIFPHQLQNMPVYTIKFQHSPYLSQLLIHFS